MEKDTQQFNDIADKQIGVMTSANFGFVWLKSLVLMVFKKLHITLRKVWKLCLSDSRFLHELFFEILRKNKTFYQMGMQI
ncbi:MAG: hypothetical protein IKH61_13940 [Bacteroidales bacterium]|nr:hypothetical protein [Bacteroidales bacterium]